MIKRTLAEFVAVFAFICVTLQSAQAKTMLVSFYGGGEKLSKYMANGQLFNTNDPTIAAHKHLPFGTKVKLHNPQNGSELVVTVQDRGPVGRDLDVSKSAAVLLGFVGQGVARLEAEVLN